MRTALVALFLSAPAFAWEFTPRPVCTLGHAEDGIDVLITFDPARDQPYEITVTSSEGWDRATVFGVRFSGGLDLSISTDRHRTMGNSIRVADSGFGNVLNGLEFNTTATFRSGESQRSVSLVDAADPVRAFRACSKGGLV